MKVKFIPQEEIEEIASDIRRLAIASGVSVDFPFDVESAVEFHFGYRLILGAELPNGMLGSTDWVNKEVRISQAVVDNLGRTRFTVAHEIGHIVLHVPILQSQESQNRLFSVEQSIVIDEKMEKQADMFAAALLMPKMVIFDRYSTQLTSGNLVEPESVSSDFGVSREAARIRLETLSILKKAIQEAD